MENKEPHQILTGVIASWLLIVIIATILFNNNINDRLDTLEQKQSDLQYKVWWLENQTQSLADNHLDLLKDIYHWEFMEAIDIATRAGYSDYTQLVSISGYMEDIRLRNPLTNIEITVNVESKTIIVSYQ